jgi:RES domain-containing protein
MFCGAADAETALRGIGWPHNGSSATTIAFETARDMLLLKLLELPASPSYFDVKQLARWNNLKFLRRFTEDLSAPVEKDGREHIDYVPTQIVTEFFRRVFRTKTGTGLDAILYPSSVGDGWVVLFVTNEQCCDDGSDDRASLVPAEATRRVHSMRLH